MSITLAQARNGMFDRFYSDWATLTPAVTADATVPHVDWQGDDDGSARDNSAPWARITVVHSIAGQQTFGEEGGRIFNRTGLVTVSVFAPLSSGQGLTQAEALATIARNAFEGKTAGPGSCIWFRNVSATEVGPTDAWFQFNVIADFLYDEIK